MARRWTFASSLTQLQEKFKRTWIKHAVSRTLWSFAVDLELNQKVFAIEKLETHKDFLQLLFISLNK